MTTTDVNGNGAADVLLDNRLYMNAGTSWPFVGTIPVGNGNTEFRGSSTSKATAISTA